MFRAHKELCHIEPKSVPEYMDALFEALTKPAVHRQEHFATANMHWAESLKHLIQTVGWFGDSRMTPTTWKYAILESFKLRHIGYLPNIYNKPPSYSNLYLLQYGIIKGPVKSLTGACTPNTHSLPRDILGFTLPFVRQDNRCIIPTFVESIFQEYIDQTKPKHHTYKPEEVEAMKSLARDVYDALNLAEPWDALVVTTALVLCRRSPLPAASPGLREKQWTDLVTK